MKETRKHFWDEILPRVQKPTRYLGNEVNAVVKDHQKCTVSMALAFPDLYEIGMSHLGLKILYHIVNQTEAWVAERVFMPDTDLEAIMRDESFPLCSLETVTPLADFDLVGFTLQYELSYATILQMLDLAGIPLRTADRKETDPLVAGGGPGAFNPEPLADFFDFFIIGDAEEALPEVFAALESEPTLTRAEKLQRLALIRGVYVPEFYRAEYDGNIFRRTVPQQEGIPEKVCRAVVGDLDAAPYPTEFLVPYGGIVHDRLVLEVFRGCTRGCRFCQAGIIYRPVRERTPNKLKRLARDMVNATGYDELALSSLSTGDYSAIEQLVTELGLDLAQDGVSLSLPSLRLDSFSGELAKQVQRVRKSGLTFAPEAGTQRLRDVINKNITEDDLLTAVADAFASGWTGVKLYFMVGLPTETDEDLLGIADLAHKVVKAYRSAGGKGKPRVTVSASVFVPKAHTPFQWTGQISKDEILRRQQLLRDAMRGKGVQFQWHGAETSLLEAALARGGRNLVPVIEHAARLGCKLDGWDEYFSFEKWQQAFTAAGLDLAALAAADFAEGDPLPWDHLDAGVAKRFLLREYKNALAGKVSGDCRENCLGCGMALLLEGQNKGACTHENMDTIC
ncbi:MAG: TIGR03960 family B12-binding radical SAM protein [Bacillota bacterium]|nr:TIGR03960 family B12-binding radical SAM protein [Bacillota bacterium]MDW7683308.1 TIGR03960 family B12-binding radical SAM protein [Bacillota bacterium]